MLAGATAAAARLMALMEMLRPCRGAQQEKRGDWQGKLCKHSHALPKTPWIAGQHQATVCAPAAAMKKHPAARHTLAQCG